MDNLQTLIENYLEYCSTQKRLDKKTLKAYKIDLRQFSEQTSLHKITQITSETLEDYIAKLHQQYKPKTVKRKIASLKAFFHFLLVFQRFLKCKKRGLRFFHNPR